MLAVSTVRPLLSSAQRERQRKGLVRFYRGHYQDFNPDLSTRWKRGILFQRLAQSDPPYPMMREQARLIRDYIIDCLRFDMFTILGLNRSLMFPDDVIVRLRSNRAVITAVIEVKLDPRHETVSRQLERLPSNVCRMVGLIGSYLERNLTPPPTPEGRKFPEGVRKIETDPDLEQILYVPEGSGKNGHSGWERVESPFNYQEVFVISAFLWEKSVTELASLK